MWKKLFKPRPLEIACTECTRLTYEAYSDLPLCGQCLDLHLAGDEPHQEAIAS